MKTTTATSGEAENLVGDIISKFEAHMNDDLGMETAFDEIFKIVSRLDALAQRGKISSKSSSLAVRSLRRIDEVLQVIF